MKLSKAQLDLKDGITKEWLITNGIGGYGSSTVLGINTRNYNITEVCKWGVDKENRRLKESLKYMQKFVNYFVKDFESQEKIYKIEKQKEDEEEME